MSGDSTMAQAYPKARFKLGLISATIKAQEALAAEGTDVLAFLKRHVVGDWGVLSESEKHENEISLTDGLEIVSAYVLPHTNVKIVVITTADRSGTTFLLPEEADEDDAELPIEVKMSDLGPGKPS
jgi:hypothetical protein